MDTCNQNCSIGVMLFCQSWIGLVADLDFHGF